MSQGRILVVDDEPHIRRVMRATLCSLGYVVADASSGEAALERVRDEKFDLILLDINMPGISGLEACRQIRAKSDVSVVMLTVRHRAEDKIEALNAGADGYITKPFDINELLARIRAALRRSPAAALAATQLIQLCDLEISFAARLVTVQGRVARLTPKEFDLLRYFVTHPNTALTHERILQAVWGPDYGDEVEYLRVFVNQLRKKIESSPSQPKYIVTEPWLGYRFVMPESKLGALAAPGREVRGELH